MNCQVIENGVRCSDDATQVLEWSRSDCHEETLLCDHHAFRGKWDGEFIPQDGATVIIDKEWDFSVE